MKAICATALKQNIRIGLLIFLALAVVGTGLYFLFDLAFSVSPKLYDALAKWAEDDFRSINGQIEYLLTECVKKRGIKFFDDDLNDS